MLRLDANNPRIAEQLGALAVAALIAGEAAIQRQQPQVWMGGPPAEDPQRETGGRF